MAERDAALGTLRGAYPVASRTAGSGIAFRIRRSEVTGRAMHRSALSHPLADVGTPQRIDLFAGDEANFPSREDA